MDIYQTDTLTTEVKFEKADALIADYRDFGWELHAESEDRIYGDVTILTFRRPHAIAHKERLQLLQVRYDAAFNRIGVWERRKKDRATVLALTLTLFGVLLLAAGIALAIACPQWLLWAVAETAAGAVLSLASMIAVERCYAADKKKYSARIAAERAAMHDLCRRAVLLREGS